MRAFVVLGLGFGDEGKGSLVDFLVREHGATEVVRFNGGAQAAHNVVTPDGRHHTFAQFGSGTFVPGVRTHLSRHMMVNPLNLFTEEEHLRLLGVNDAFSRLSIDADALITTPFHVAANRLRERARGEDRHGSCGLGIGETMKDALEGERLTAAALGSRQLRRRLYAIQARKREEIHPLLPDVPLTDEAREEIRTLVDSRHVEWCADAYGTLRLLATVKLGHEFEDAVVFEGAQGVLLDQAHGFHPYTTWSDCTLANAEELLDGYAGEVTRIGVTRAYMTRHGPGPFVTEGIGLESELGRGEHNDEGPWQGHFRAGWTDLVALRYAAEVAGELDELAVTCVDRIEHIRDRWKVCSGYRLERHRLKQLNGAPVGTLPVAGRTLHPALPPLPAENLTRFVECCDPIYDEARGSLVPDIIGEALGLPVTITSHGPTAGDKAVAARKLAYRPRRI